MKSGCVLYPFSCDPSTSACGLILLLPLRDVIFLLPLCDVILLLPLCGVIFLLPLRDVIRGVGRLKKPKPLKQRIAIRGPFDFELRGVIVPAAPGKRLTLRSVGLSVATDRHSAT